MNVELSPLIAGELVGARDIAALMGLTPRAVRLRMKGIAPQFRDGIQVWPVQQLPRDYQIQLEGMRRKQGAWMLEDLVRIATPRWQPDFKLATLPAFSQLKAQKVRAVMIAYFEALDRDLREHEANCEARDRWLQEFSSACSEKTIRNWAAKIELRGGVEWAPLEAYADRKATPHLAARLENREKRRVPSELIREFKALCVQPDMNMAAAFRKLELDWQTGHEVAGIGTMPAPRTPFPFKLTQLRKFAPSMAARKLGNRGKAEARRDALSHMTRTYAELRACEMYVMDDTRINVTVANDASGLPTEIKAYVCMEVASRKIVGYVLREGNMRATDVDALMARVLRTSGLAHPMAGYATTFLFERGSVACSPARQEFIESMFGGRLKIRRTSMDGGQNMPGDFVQASSGHWMGKGVIESFMRTLGYITRHIAGQRGSTYQTMPTMVGYPNDAHAGSQVAEAKQLIQAARAAVYLKSNGADAEAPAKEAVDAMGVKPPLLFFSEFRNAFALAITAYNDETDHRREGFRQIGEEQTDGGLRYRAESSNERWTWLNWQAEQTGRAPQRIAPAEAVMLLHQARPVTITPNGVTITVDGRPARYWHQDSLVCMEARRVTTLKKEYTAICDPEDRSGIYLLKNAWATWNDGDTAQFLEWLPLYVKPGEGDSSAKAATAELHRVEHNRVSRELAAAAEPYLEQLTADRRDNTAKMHGVVATTNGECREVRGLGQLSKQMALQRSRVRNKGNGRENPGAEDVGKIDALHKFLNTDHTQEGA
jgi:hypothetical protein